MGHRSYLYVKDSHENEILLFEANNSLPLFWLTLIDKQTLESKIKDWESFERIDYEDYDAIDVWEENNSLEFFMTKNQFNKNSRIGLDYIKRLNADYVSLYQEFTHLISSNFKDNYELVIDIFQLRGFKEHLIDFVEPLRNQVESITHQEKNTNYFLFPEDLIASGSGFVCVDLEEDSKLVAYEEAAGNRKIVLTKNEYRYNLKQLLRFIVLLLICPLFSFFTYKGFKKEGFSFMVVFLGITNILFYIYVIWEIWAQLKAFKDLKKNKQLSVD